MTVVESRGGLGGAGIAATAGLGQTECAQSGTAGQFGQPFALLRLSTEPVDRHRTEGHPAFQRDGHTLVDLGELFQRQTQGEVVTPHTAVLLGEGQSEQTHTRHPGHDLVRE